MPIRDAARPDASQRPAAGRPALPRALTAHGQTGQAGAFAATAARRPGQRPPAQAGQTRRRHSPPRGWTGRGRASAPLSPGQGWRAAWSCKTAQEAQGVGRGVRRARGCCEGEESRPDCSARTSPGRLCPSRFACSGLLRLFRPRAARCGPPLLRLFGSRPPLYRPRRDSLRGMPPGRPAREPAAPGGWGRRPDAAQAPPRRGKGQRHRRPTQRGPANGRAPGAHGFALRP
jgi:hypothetical protein